MSRGCAFLFALVVGDVACAERSSGPEPASTTDAETTATTSDGGPISIEDCEEITVQAECEAALPPVGGLSGCAWIEVRLPGPTCGDAVEPRCFGMISVGPGCQGFDCPSGTDGIDAFVRSVDGTVEAFESPQCGLVPSTADWTHCNDADHVAECTCLCEG